VNFLCLYLAMTKFTGDLGTPELLKTFIKLAVAGAIMGGICWAANQFMFGRDPTHLHLILRIIVLGATIGLAAAIYFAIAKVLRVAEADEALGMVLRRFRR
jgi:peptidoglycan biosynthesis protein MviN/MurJ (putative lipid II flippase)